MLIFDQLKKSDRQLQIISIGLLAGMAVLVCGLWWVQIITSKRHEANLKRQSLRLVRVPALRGKILDRNGTVLAENSPRYDINVYFEELLDQFSFEYTNSVRKEFLRQNPAIKKIPSAVREELSMEARYRAVSNVTYRVGAALQQGLILERKKFISHYRERPFMPFPLFRSLTQQQVAIFSERQSELRGVELEVQPVRVYPNSNACAHVVGYVQWQDAFEDDEEINFKSRLPDFAGKMGVESAFDSILRGKAGVKSLLVNNMGYRQREEMAVPSKPGQNIWLTIDLAIQQATEKALASAMARTRGAAVVMDVQTGDILAIASAPAFDPNMFLDGLSAAEAGLLYDKEMRPEFNRATFGTYTPGSIFKIITAIACFEANVVDPRAKFDNPGFYQPNKNAHRIDDTAPPGEYDFERAFKRSSNTYFIHYGLKAGVEKIVEVGKRFHLGEKTDIPTRQEVSGSFPSPNQLGSWTATGRTANMCIGQEITVTPLQMVCMTAAIANGGKLFWPRIVVRSESPVGDDTGAVSIAPARVREQIGFNPQHLNLIRRAMLADVVDPSEGTGRAAYIPDYTVAGKTGTAEVLVHGKKDKNTWFASYGPYENPRYAVVVMVESGASGGGTCAPVAKKIYEAIQKREASARLARR